MKSKYMPAFFLIVILFFAVPAFPDAQSAADELFSYVNLNALELSLVRDYYQTGQYSQALDEYKDIFLEDIYQLSFSPMPSASASADDMLNSNLVRIYNLEGGYETHDIGIPGSIDWYIEADFEHWNYFLSNMHWTSPLVTRFTQSPSSNGQYLQKWVDYWHDFSLNNYDQWNTILGSPSESLYGSMFRNIWLHRLILGDRIKYFLSQLSEAVKADPVIAKSIIGGEQLAVMLSEMAQRNMPRLNDTIHGGVPNQVISSALGLMQAGFGFENFYDAPTWMATGEYEIQDYLNMYYMQDGTDMEQSFNYNGSMIDIGIQTQLLYISSGTVLPQWAIDYGGAMLYRFRMLCSIVRPNGMIPSLDLQSDADAYGRLSGYQAYFNDPLAGQIIDHTWSFTPSQPLPGFDSIYFPYGGYAIIRDGWGSNAAHLFMKNSRMGKGHYDNSANQVQITAFGKTLLIDSGGSLYVPDYRNDYFHNSFGHNTILVDGKSQNMGGEYSPAYTTTLSNRFLTGASFDFVEGAYGNGINGGYGNGSIEITDVTHRREVTFLREAGIYVILDRLESPLSHTYTQVWNYDKDFDKSEVNLAAVDKIITTKPFQPNVAIYNFSEQTLTYTMYHGFYDGANVYGWAKSGTGYIPAVDTHRSWTASGNQILVTLVAPMMRDNEPVTVTSKSATGEMISFTAVSDSGYVIKYGARKSGGTIVVDDITAEASSLLVTEKDGIIRGVALDCSSFEYAGEKQGVLASDFEFVFEDDNFAVSANVTVPSDFYWIEDGTSTRPAYSDAMVSVDIQVQPSYITSITPSPGVYQIPVNTNYSLTAQDLVECPNVDGFVHWLVDGEYYSDASQIDLTATKDISIAAVYSDVRQCGDICHPVPMSDINGDCRVDADDLAIMAQNWLFE
jgi:hypothetical protein